jgi:cyclophilin family peptidyl-prolyl cis-trans isomerase
MARSREWAVCVSLFGLLVLTVCFAQNLLRSIDVTEKAGITFSLDGEAQPEIEIGLFGSVVPKGVEFFKKMCNKPRGRGAFVEYTPIVQSLLKVMYFIEGNMSKTHIVPQRSIDIEENSVPHDTFAFGVGTNQEDKGYRFYITLGKNDHMNSKYLVLGRVMTQKRQLMNYSELYYQPIQMSEEL